MNLLSLMLLSNYKKFIHVALIAIAFTLFLPVLVNAAPNDGTIDPDNEGNNQAKLLDGAGYSDLQINFGDFTSQANYRIHITDNGITGLAWGETTGWIVMNCEDAASNCSVMNGNFKVDVADDGALSGYAWGENAGWINFGPFSNTSISSVKIFSNGDFGGTLGSAGYAWSENFGWIVFDCTNPLSCVETDYRPKDFRSGGGGSGGGGGGGGGGSGGGGGGGGGEPPVYQCSDGKDNDGDGLIDYPKDPGCSRYSDNSEVNRIPQCQNGIDDDKDGLIDFPLDTGCLSLIDDNELGDADSFDDPPPGDLGPNDPPPNGGGGGSGGSGYLNPLNVPRQFLEDLLGGALQRFIAQFMKLEKAFIAIALAGLGAFIFNNFYRFAQWLLWFFGFQKRRKKWGTVYDSVTKYPLDPAYVTVKNATGELIAESITDLDGRYGFLLPAGVYKVAAQKTNYIFPSRKLAGLSQDIVYDDLYFGEEVTINKDEEVISKNIPMDPIAFDWNEMEKRRRNLGVYSKKVGVKKILGILFYVGTFSAFILCIINPTPLNIIIASAYALLIFLSSFSAVRGSLVRFGSSGKYVPFAVVKIFALTDGREVAKKVTSSEGRFFVLLANGAYYLTISIKGPDMSYALAHTSEPFIVKSGLINKKITI